MVYFKGKWLYCFNSYKALNYKSRYFIKPPKWSENNNNNTSLGVLPCLTTDGFVSKEAVLLIEVLP